MPVIFFRCDKLFHNLKKKVCAVLVSTAIHQHCNLIRKFVQWWFRSVEEVIILYIAKTLHNHFCPYWGLRNWVNKGSHRPQWPQRPLRRLLLLFVIFMIRWHLRSRFGQLYLVLMGKRFHVKTQKGKVAKAKNVDVGRHKQTKYSKWIVEIGFGPWQWLWVGVHALYSDDPSSRPADIIVMEWFIVLKIRD